MISLESHKKRIIEQIQGIDNEKTLAALDVVLDSLKIQEIQHFTTEPQKQSILQGINDIENGNCFSQEEIDNLDLKWLNEK